MLEQFIAVGVSSEAAPEVGAGADQSVRTPPLRTARRSWRFPQPDGADRVAAVLRTGSESPIAVRRRIRRGAARRVNTPLCPLVERCTSNRLSSLELSCQAMSIWFCPELTAMGFDGAASCELAAFAADASSGTARGPAGCSVQPTSSAAEVGADEDAGHDVPHNCLPEAMDDAAAPSCMGVATGMVRLGRPNAWYRYMCGTTRKADMASEWALADAPLLPRLEVNVAQNEARSDDIVGADFYF